MGKKFTDLKATKNPKNLNLKEDNSELKKNAQHLKKPTHKLKAKSAISEVSDIKGAKKQNYKYIKGKKFTPPKYLDSLLKIGTLGFLILITINTINVYSLGKALEKELSATAYEGVNYLIDAGKSATKIEFDKAITAFNNASSNFSDVQDKLWFISQDKSIYNTDNSMGQAANGLLEGGKYFSTAGKYFLEALDEFNKIPLYFFSQNDLTTDTPPSITDALKKGLEHTELAITEIDQASQLVSKIREDELPPDLKSRVTLTKQKVSEVSEILAATAKHFPSILKLLGDRYPHRYLIILQNNNEIRPTGGFIGSYAIMDLNDGYIEKLDIHDVYDLDGSYGGVIEPPEEFKNFTSNWRLRDSNYSPDFPTSAKKIRWFLETQGGSTVDTVIAINQGLLKDLLEITGPVQVGEFGKLNSNNYELLLSYIIEGKIWGPENPKHILKVFIPAFKSALLKEENVAAVSSKLYKAVQQKHIMVYSAHDDVQELMESIGLDGSVEETPKNEDYLSVINTAYGGTKSEKFMREEIVHNTEIDKIGTVINEVTVTRKHQWSDDVYLKWKQILRSYGFSKLPDPLIDILGRGANKVGVRVYVPEGSVLLETNGSQVQTKYDKDLKKTYFYFRMETHAGEEESIWIRYRPPIDLKFKPTATYKLTVEKQPGSIGSVFKKNLKHHDSLDTILTYPEDVQNFKDGTSRYLKDLVYDRYFSALISK